MYNNININIIIIYYIISLYIYVYNIYIDSINNIYIIERKHYYKTASARIYSSTWPGDSRIDAVWPCFKNDPLYPKV